MRRGEVRWYTFKPPDKRRPVLILTRNATIGLLNTVTVAPITTTIRDIPSQVFLSQQDGMLTECTVSADNLQTVAQSKIGQIITRLSSERMIEVKQAINFALGLDSPFGE
ncbi:type II toxin-antitoxin system PemK/MazF family toxin [Anaerolineales bacterium HSG24]|nr:type II toxin-antitoxin system PemK/MazF family toxin [Anaerolineales bacterium HSG24]